MRVACLLLVLSPAPSAIPQFASYAAASTAATCARHLENAHAMPRASPLPTLAVRPSLPHHRAQQAVECRLSSRRTPTTTQVSASVRASSPLNPVLTVTLGSDAVARHLTATSSTPSQRKLTLQRSLGELRNLRADVQNCVGRRGKHCAQCKETARYLRLCWETPRLIHQNLGVRGGAYLRADVLEYFFLRLLELTEALLVSDDCVEHMRFADRVVEFLRTSDAIDSPREEEA